MTYKRIKKYVHFWYIVSIFVVLFIFGKSIPVQAAESAVSVQLDSSATELSVGDTFTLSVSIKLGSTQSNLSIGTVSIPGIENFARKGSYSKTSLQSINGETAAVTQHSYQLVATQAGDFTIGPIFVSLPGSASTTQSNSIAIHVTKKGIFQNTTSPEDAPTTNTDTQTYPTSRSLPSWAPHIDTLLFIILILVLVFIFYLTVIQKDTKKSPKQHANSQPSEVATEVAIDDDSSVHSVPIAPDSKPPPLFDLSVLNTLNNKELAKLLITKIDTLLDNENFNNKEKRELLETIKNECAVSRYAPPGDTQKEKIINLLTHYIQLYGNETK